MVGSILQRFTREPLAHTTIALYELPMQYPSVRWRQIIPPTVVAAAGVAHETIDQTQEAWLARTVIMLVEDQVPLLTRELQGRVITRLDEFVDYRVQWDRFAQQAPPREEGGLLLAQLDVRIVQGRPPRLQTHLQQQSAGRSAFSILATLLDGFATDTIRAMPPARQSWACLWLTYLILWYNAAGPTALRGRASRHPHFFLPDGVPEAADFPQ